MDMESVFRIHKGNDEYKEISHGGTIIWERAISKTASGDGTQFMPTRSSTSYAALSAVTAFGGTEQRNLPDGYTQLEYIESAGTQAINTGVKYSGNDFVVKWKAVDTTTGSNTTLFACVGATPYSGGLYGNKTYRTYYIGSSPSLNIGYASNDDNFHEWEVTVSGQNITLKKDGVQVGTETFADTINTTHDIYLFCGGWTNNTSPTLTQFSSWRLGYWQLWKSGTIVRNLIPAKRNSDNVLGVYDTVSQTFFTNAGTGTFTAGGEAVPTPDTPMDIISNNGVLKVRHQSGLPLGYTLLDYIESTGTQYIDTGIVDITDSEFVLDARLTATSASGFPTMLGALNSAYEYKYKVVFGETSGTLFYTQPGVGNSNYTYASAADTNRHIFKLTTGATSGGTLLIDNNSLNFNYEIQSDTTLSLYLSARNNNGNATNFITMACYGLQIKKSGVLVRNFVPAKDSNNVIGMYDLVSGQFFTNQGTGDFVAGPNAVDPITIVTDGDVETINVHGKNLFDRATVTNGYYISVTGQIVENAASMYSDYIKVKPSTTYTISLISGSNGNAVRVHSYTSDKNWIEQLSEVTTGVEGSSYSATFTTSSNAEYIRFGCRQAQIDIQIEQGSVATEYEPYYDGGTATAEMLLSIGDYTDVQEILSGNITRKVGIKVLDGTEAWTKNAGVYPFVPNLLPTRYHSGTTIISNYYKGNTAGNGAADYGDYSCWVQSTPEYPRLYIRDDRFTTLSVATTGLDDFKAFLAAQYAAGTPVIVIYPLATETTESVTGQPMSVVKDVDYVQSIVTASLDGLNIESTYLGK